MQRPQDPIGVSAPRLSFVPEAVLFDLDGTLVDTEPLFELSEHEYLAKWGIVIDEELRHELFGQSAKGFFSLLERRFPESGLNRLSLDERLEAKNANYFKVATGRIATFPAMEVLARGIAARGLPLAIGSSSNHLIIDFELEAVGLADLFPVRVSAVDVPRGKPEPDIFLEAARRLGVDPKRCVIFEDSFLGLRAGKASGAFTVSLPAPDALLERFASADLLVAGGPAKAKAGRLLDFLFAPGNPPPSGDDQ
jgi:HAD superfamily hydrolase (TIGR01509 family)